MKVICPTCGASVDLDPDVVAIFATSGADVTVRCPTCRYEIGLPLDPDRVTTLDFAGRRIVYPAL
jgi:DNA-directed RNA polymerase subunit RPC12/RpoP